MVGDFGLAYSPHFNTIERAIVKKMLHKQVVTWESLEQKLLEIWGEVDAETVRHLHDSFLNRLEKVKSKKGTITGCWKFCATFRILDFR